MPGEMARSDPRPAFGLPELLVAIHTSRQSCSKAGKARIFALVCGSSEESRAREAQRMKNAGELSLLAAADGRCRDCRRDKTKRSFVAVYSRARLLTEFGGATEVTT